MTNAGATATVGIIGARISGSFLGWLLAREGTRVLLFDHRGGKEKACGGGLTHKAYRRIPSLEDAPLERTSIERMVLINARFPDGVWSRLDPPLWIYARRDLDGYLRGKAIEAGADFREARVEDIIREGARWSIHAGGETHACDFLVGADGVRSLLKSRFARPFASDDLSLALGYYVPGAFHRDTIFCEFFPAPFQGYLWAFPRHDHLSVGILESMDRADPEAMRAAVAARIGVHYPQVDPAQCRRYAAPVPTLRAESLDRNIVSSVGWAVVGDAAGFADAITGEGIYYALRSAEILARCLRRGRPEAYADACRRDFGAELRLAARWKGLFYGRRAGSRTVAGLAVRLAARSARFRRLLAEWTAGQAAYGSLLRRVAFAAPHIAAQCLWPTGPQNCHSERSEESLGPRSSSEL